MIITGADYLSLGATEKHQLPKLPEGWNYEPHVFADVLHVVWPDHGVASVHFKFRTVASGWCIPNRPPSLSVVPHGRGWQKELVGQAVMLLRSAWNAGEE